MTVPTVIPRFRVLLSMITLFGMMTTTAGASIYQRGARSMQVTGALDWSRPADSYSEKNDQSRNQQAPTDASGSTSPMDYQDDPGLDSALHIPEGSLASAQVKKSSTKGLTMGILITVLVSIAIILAVLVLKRRHQVQRWREYRTFQVLRFQDEAFDLSYDESFDLELVEGASL